MSDLVTEQILLGAQIYNLRKIKDILVKARAAFLTEAIIVIPDKKERTHKLLLDRMNRHLKQVKVLQDKSYQFELKDFPGRVKYFGYGNPDKLQTFCGISFNPFEGEDTVILTEILKILIFIVSTSGKNGFSLQVMFPEHGILQVNPRQISAFP